MTIVRIDHINIAGSAELIARCRAFYVDVLGLADGHRPPFRSRGFWLYAGDAPVVHLTERDGNGVAHAGPFSHYAFQCEDLDAMSAKLKEHAIEFTIDHVPATRQTQLFLHDPAGVPLELNFDAS
ncbi:MAG TPA: VOC family protein [Thermoanaerobaculia bacterium]|nr:VOC family protein [Thermoanaerobaculia bacterium]